MKNHYLFFLMLFFALSCIDSAEKYEKDLKELIGEWQLQQMTYTNEKGEFVNAEKVSSSIKFSNVFTTQADGNMSKSGTLYVGNDSVDFQYEFNFYDNRISIHIDRELIKDMPIFTFGKLVIYEFELIDKKELVFTTDFEYVYPTNEKLTYPVYVFKR
jgi:uncharacterized protein YcfL